MPKETYVRHRSSKVAIEARFDSSYIITSSGCWMWLGNTLRGYGSIWLGDRNYLAHRYSYQRFVGPLDTTQVIDHVCCNKLCVCPDHLEQVTQAENVRRALGTSCNRLSATHCPWDRWKNVDRWVKKGSKAFGIVRPITIKKTDEETGEETAFQRFKVVRAVFPYSMTDGEPLLPAEAAG